MKPHQVHNVQIYLFTVQGLCTLLGQSTTVSDWQHKYSTGNTAVIAVRAVLATPI